jgi:hypothetical protein
MAPLQKGSQADVSVAYARYFAVSTDGAGWHGPSEHKVFKQLLAFAGNSHLKLQSWGVLIVPDHVPIKNDWCSDGAWFSGRPKVRRMHGRLISLERSAPLTNSPFVFSTCVLTIIVVLSSYSPFS